MYALSGPIAISGLGATEDAEEDLPTRSEVKAGYQAYVSLGAPDFPIRSVNGRPSMGRKDAIDWSAASLDRYAESKGISPTSPHYTAVRDVVATAAGGKGFDIDSAQYAEYARALGEMSGAASSAYFEASVELGVVTFDTLRDGKFTQNDAKQMGQVTGAIVGGVVAQAFGVPAPIGAMAGGAIGGGTAAIIHDAIAGENLQKKANDLARQARKEAEQQRKEAISKCTGIESLYWQQVDSFYSRFARAWVDAENNLLWRFGLRWFDPNPGLAFRYEWDKGARRPGSIKRSDTLGFDYACGTQVVYHSQGEEHIRSCKYKCPYVYGCPYPHLVSGVQARLPSKDVPIVGTGGGTNRVAEAFAARGVLWLTPSARLSCDQYLPQIPSGNLATNYQQRKQWQDSIQVHLDNQVAKLVEFQRARTLLQADLLRTVTCLQAEKEIWMKRAEFLTDGWKAGAYDEAIRRSQQMSSLLGWTVLGGGTALFGYSLWRALR